MLELENGQAYETTGASTFLPNMMSDLLDNEIESQAERGEVQRTLQTFHLSLYDKIR